MAVCTNCACRFGVVAKLLCEFQLTVNHFLMGKLVLLVMTYCDWVFDDTTPVETPSEIMEKLD